MTKNFKKTSILVVDDSDVIRNSLKNFFSEYKLDVITSNDGLDGIQKVAEHQPALIFLDILMPNFDGIKMLQVIKVLDNIKTIPVIVISGNTNRTNVLACIEAGADRVISKPLKKEIIIKNINELLGVEFLAGAKKTGKLSEGDKESIVAELRNSFLSGFPERKENVTKYLADENADEMRIIAHSLKGEGGMIGSKKLSVLGGLIEDRLSANEINWGQVKIMWDQVFALVEELDKAGTIDTE